MNFNEIQTEAKAFLDILVNKYNIKEFFEYESCSDKLDWLDFNKIGYAHGATRIALFSDEFPNLIVKIPQCSDDDFYNIQENKVYQLAMSKGVNEWLATTYLIDFEVDEYYSVPLLFMERCECDEWSLSDLLEDRLYQEWLDDNGYEDNSENRDNFYCGSCEPEDEEIIDFAGRNHEVGSCDFQDFVDDIGINDLHCGNWGYNSKRQLVVTDYAGYCRHFDI